MARNSALALLAVAVSGCALVRVSDLSVMATEPLPPAGTPLQPQSTGVRTDGEHCQQRLLLDWIPLGPPASIEEATRQAAAKVDAVALTDTVISVNFFTILLYSRQCFVVEGTPLLSAATAAARPPVPAPGPVSTAPPAPAASTTVAPAPAPVATGNWQQGQTVTLATDTRVYLRPLNGAETERVPAGSQCLVELVTQNADGRWAHLNCGSSTGWARQSQ